MDDLAERKMINLEIEPILSAATEMEVAEYIKYMTQSPSLNQHFLET